MYICFVPYLFYKDSLKPVRMGVALGHVTERMGVALGHVTERMGVALGHVTESGVIISVS